MVRQSGDYVRLFKNQSSINTFYDYNYCAKSSTTFEDLIMSRFLEILFDLVPEVSKSVSLHNSQEKRRTPRGYSRTIIGALGLSEVCLFKLRSITVLRPKSFNFGISSKSFLKLVSFEKIANNEVAFHSFRLKSN